MLSAAVLFGTFMVDCVPKNYLLCLGFVCTLAYLAKPVKVALYLQQSSNNEKLSNL